MENKNKDYIVKIIKEDQEKTYKVSLYLPFVISMELLKVINPLKKEFDYTVIAYNFPNLAGNILKIVKENKNLKFISPNNKEIKALSEALGKDLNNKISNKKDFILNQEEIKDSNSIPKYLKYISEIILGIPEDYIKTFYEKYDLNSNCKVQIKNNFLNKYNITTLKKLSSLIEFINHWLECFSSNNLKEEVVYNFNTRPHFIREFSNHFIESIINYNLKSAYVFIEYKKDFEAYLLPLDYHTKRLKTIIKELEDRKKAGTIIFSDYEVKSFIRLNEGGMHTKGGIVRVKDFMNSEFIVDFALKMRGLTDYEVIDELRQFKLEDVKVPKLRKYKSVMSN